MDISTDLVFDETDILYHWGCSSNGSQFCKLLGFAAKENRLVSMGKFLVEFMVWLCDPLMGRPLLIHL